MIDRFIVELYRAFLYKDFYYLYHDRLVLLDRGFNSNGYRDYIYPLLERIKRLANDK